MPLCYYCDLIENDPSTEWEQCTACVAKDAQRALENARDAWKEYVGCKRELDVRNRASRAVDNEIAKL